MLHLLLLSNSTNPGQSYFQWALPHVADFLPDSAKNIIFIPYAVVAFDYNNYEDKVNKAWQQVNKKVCSIHSFQNQREAIENADAIVVGGGNTWQLISMLYKNDLLASIRNKIIRGTPYIGWSAGSNIACPSIKTTNDMPVVAPASFQALQVVPFQINPHYTEDVIPNHGGETRAQRIEEYIQLNPQTYVVGLPEGCLLRIDNENVSWIGDKRGKLFLKDEPAKTISGKDNLQFLLNPLQ